MKEKRQYPHYMDYKSPPNKRKKKILRMIQVVFQIYKKNLKNIRKPISLRYHNNKMEMQTEPLK